jgi:hypothetical protein
LALCGFAHQIPKTSGLPSDFWGAGATWLDLSPFVRRIPSEANGRHCATAEEHIGGNRIQAARTPVKFTKFSNPAECFRDHKYFGAGPQKIRWTGGVF